MLEHCSSGFRQNDDRGRARRWSSGCGMGRYAACLGCPARLMSRSAPNVPLPLDKRRAFAFDAFVRDELIFGLGRFAFARLGETAGLTRGRSVLPR